MNTRSWKHLTQKEYLGLKTMIALDGVKLSNISKVTGRSYQTLGNIRRSESFTDYQTIVKELTSKLNERYVPKTQTTGDINQQVLNRLDVIAKLLQQLVEGQPKQNGQTVSYGYPKFS